MGSGVVKVEARTVTERELASETAALALEREPIWVTAGRIVISRDGRPAMVVDANGCIQAANGPLIESGMFVANGIVGRPWVKAWTFDAEGRQAIAEATSHARKEEVAQVTAYVTTPDGGTAMCYFELAQLGPPEDGVLIVSVFSARVPSRPRGVPPTSGLNYELEISTWRLRHVSSFEGRPVSFTGTCFQAIMGRETPCDNCPVAALATEGRDQARAVSPDTSAPRQLKVLTARRLDTNRASVSTWTVDEGLMSLLIDAEVNGLAKAAGLSERERAVLDLLLLGRTHAEIATVLGITARTVKYHQGRMQDKLGIDSRLDLLRIVL